MEHHIVILLAVAAITTVLLVIMQLQDVRKFRRYLHRYKQALEIYANRDNWDAPEINGARHDFRVEKYAHQFGDSFREDGFVYAERALRKNK